MNQGIRPWCGICMHLLNDEDEVVVVTADCNLEESSTLLYFSTGLEAPRRRKTPDSACSSETWDSNSELDDDECFSPSWVLLAGGSPPNQLAMACHLECASLILSHSVSHQEVDKFLRMTWYEYAPYRSERDQRREWLRREFNLALHRHEGDFSLRQRQADCCLSRARTRLSPEILSLIISCSLRFLEAVNALSTSKSLILEEFRYDFSLAAHIWAQVVSFEGHTYFKGLSHEPLRRTGEVDIKVQQRSDTLDAVYLAYDYLGIRKLYLSDCNNTVTHASDHDPGLWWQTIPLAGKSHLKGTKMRRLDSDGPETPRPMSWSVPQPLGMTFRCETLNKLSNNLSRPPVRMKLVDLDHADTEGLSACFIGNVMSIHAHMKGKDKSSFCRDWLTFHHTALCLYMPIDEDERVSEIWTFQQPRISHWNTLVMRTDRNRIWTVGPQPKRGQLINWELLDLRQEGSKGIYVEESYYGIDHIVFESGKPLRAGRVPPMEKTLSICPERQGVGFFYSSASLTGVASIAVCHGYDKYARQPLILGVLLHYRDGRERSLGQVRHHALKSPVCVDHSIGIGYRLSSYDPRKIAELDLAVVQKDGWVLIPWQGSLDWWFSMTECKLAYNKEIE
ncbi:hypothetical protein CEP52_015751 [Fusarium oligoseptatum]|uniref:Uncharacterized protein n=1 Tax=Fusarium oligoseptatum TaxID=2604345 RepID=A0A428SA69_9HYPO|nr:hypothetical protein CEP52_015751 [Fusarium oligoseptatum]